MTTDELSALTDADLNALAAKCMSRFHIGGRLWYHDWHPCSDQNDAFDIQAKAMEHNADRLVDCLASVIRADKRTHAQLSPQCCPGDFVRASARQRTISAIAALRNGDPT